MSALTADPLPQCVSLCGWSGLGVWGDVWGVRGVWWCRWDRWRAHSTVTWSADCWIGQGRKRAKNSAGPDTQSTDVANATSTSSCSSSSSSDGSITPLQLSVLPAVSSSPQHVENTCDVPLVSYAAARTTEEPKGKLWIYHKFKILSPVKIEPRGKKLAYIQTRLYSSYNGRQANPPPPPKHPQKDSVLTATVNSRSRDCGLVRRQAKWWGRSLSKLYPFPAFVSTSSSSSDSLMSSRTKPSAKARLPRLQESGRKRNNTLQAASHLRHEHNQTHSLHYVTEQFRCQYIHTSSFL